MDLKITVQCELAGAEKTYELEFGEPEISIGSDESNMVPIPDPDISDWHARIESRGDDLYLVDLGSSNGTVVDGNRIAPTGKAKLTSTSEIRLSSYRLTLADPGRPIDDVTSEKTSMVAMDMVKAILGSVSDLSEEPPVLEVTNDAEAGTRLKLKEERSYNAGRERSCELVLKHWSISRKHACFRRSGSEVTIMDLESKNGVLLNGDRLTGSKRLKNGDVISIGHTEVRFTLPGTGAVNLGGTTSGVMSVPKQAPAAPPPSESAPPPKRETRAAPPRESAPPARERELPPDPTAPDRPPRKLEKETSLADYIPIILGVILLLAAAGVAIYLFVIKK